MEKALKPLGQVLPDQFTSIERLTSHKGVKNSLNGTVCFRCSKEPSN